MSVEFSLTGELFRPSFRRQQAGFAPGTNILADQIISALSNAVEAKDRYTNGHSKRVAEYSLEIARRLGWSQQQQAHVYYAGLLHDVGKIRVSDAIINKKGKMTEAEYEEMKLHPLAGYYILKEISAVSDFAVGARWHHERYDGRGYPNGLSGENIPLIARVIGIADAYDAMTSNRTYRSCLTQTQVRREIEQGAGTQFDPEMARVVLSMIDDDQRYFLRQPDPPTVIDILAIDDDPLTLRLLDFTLGSTEPYRIRTELTGKDGLDYIKTHHVDLVLLDVEMPEMDGFEVLEKIREIDPLLPVIFMTGDKEFAIIQRAEAMGVSDYLTKPLVPRMLRESITSVLSAFSRM